MVHYWKTAQRRALMNTLRSAQLQHCLISYAAGYKRGLADVRVFAAYEEWTSLTGKISRQLARDHSVIEAGCWLAGMRTGRSDALVGQADLDAIIERRFCSDWNSEYISECALECQPRAVKAKLVFRSLWKKSRPSLILDKDQLQLRVHKTR